jgi:hypothetical protein
MADTKISALPASTVPLAGTEVLPIVQSSATKQVSVANLTAGRAISATQMTLTTGNLIVASGQGVDFSATAGTGTSELLADYEEGTWTPAGVLSSPGSSATSNVVATYTKVGRLVNVVCSFTFTLNTGSGNFSINGLPFAASSALVYTAFAQGCEGVGALTKVVVGYINPSNTNFYLLLQSQSTVAATQLTSGEMAAASTIRISASYAT